MRVLLIALFTTILLAMLFVTVQASLERNVATALEELWSDGWFRATLADAYFGFLVVFVWIAYREQTLWRAVPWFVALMLLGNIAIAIYFLLALLRSPDGGVGTLFRPLPAAGRGR